MAIHRREFLRLSGLATASLMIPKFLSAFENGNPVAPGNKVVVVLQLSGGNDGLNTVIPVRNDLYYKARPSLAIAKGHGLGVTDEVALNPALANFRKLYDAGYLGILNNVGYPNPDRSHFRSMDIWQSASSSDEYISTGWLGRYLDSECNGCDRPTGVLEMDEMLSRALKGNNVNGLAFKDIKQLNNYSNDSFLKNLAVSTKGEVDDHKPVDYLYKTMARTISSSDYIFDKTRSRPSKAAYPDTSIGKDLKTMASLIFSDIDTQVYYLSLGTFDTHFNQLVRQEKLLKQMDDAVYAFVQDLKANNRFDDVLLFTFSEFGRRVAQNASKGTDHGTANNMFLISGGLKQKGIINAMPNLADLDDGDLKYNVDFKSVYATILNKWLGANDRVILNNHQYDYLKFI